MEGTQRGASKTRMEGRGVCARPPENRQVKVYFICKRASKGIVKWEGKRTRSGIVIGVQ